MRQTSTVKYPGGITSFLDKNMSTAAPYFWKKLLMANSSHDCYAKVDYLSLKNVLILIAFVNKIVCLGVIGQRELS